MVPKDSRQTRSTAKASQVASSARVRDNQRRSRARRKEYIQDLEQRLRRFESLGVQATQEIQEAARQVVAENILLRSLLRDVGVPEKDVKDYLKSHTVNPVPLDEPWATGERIMASRLPTTQGNYPVERTSGPAPFYLQAKDSSQEEMGARGVSSSPLASIVKPSANSAKGRSPGGERPAEAHSVGPDAASVRGSSGTRDTGQSMPCEAAVRIITSMRGYHEGRDVRSELGCHSNSDCMVRNMDIFAILDK